MKKKVLFASILLVLLALLTALAVSCGKRAVIYKDTDQVQPGVYKFGKKITFIYKPLRENVVSVALTGDFNNWNTSGLPLTKLDDYWTITINLEYGIYQYNFVLDGKDIVPDHHAEAYAPDGKGGKNSIVEVSR